MKNVLFLLVFVFGCSQKQEKKQEIDQEAKDATVVQALFPTLRSNGIMVDGADNAIVFTKEHSKKNECFRFYEKLKKEGIDVSIDTLESKIFFNKSSFYIEFLGEKNDFKESAGRRIAPKD